MTDRELIEHYRRDRAEAAFTALVERHIGMVHAAALRQVGGDAHLAQDVTQAVFIDLANRLHRLPPKSLAGWLYTSTRFSAANAVRAERRRRDRENKALLMKSHEPEPIDAAWQQIRPVLDGALTALAHEDRDAVILRFFESKSYGEIGAELRLKEDTARVRVERALGKLAAVLQRRGITSKAEALALVLTAQGATAAPAGLSATVAHTAFDLAGKPVAAAVIKTASVMTTTKTVTTAAICAVVVLLSFELGQTRREVASLQATLSRSDTPPSPAVHVPAPVPTPMPAAVKARRHRPAPSGHGATTMHWATR